MCIKEENTVTVSTGLQYFSYGNSKLQFFYTERFRMIGEEFVLQFILRIKKIRKQIKVTLTSNFKRFVLIY